MTVKLISFCYPYQKLLKIKLYYRSSLYTFEVKRASGNIIEILQLHAVIYSTHFQTVR